MISRYTERAVSCPALTSGKLDLLGHTDREQFKMHT